MTTSLIKLTSVSAILVAIFLVIGKVFAWYISGSVAVGASLIDSISDLVTSAINFFTLRYALQPADEDHRFGHGKAEALAGLLQSIFIIISAVALVFHTIEDILHPHPLNNSKITVTVMLFSMILTGLLVLLQRYTIYKTKSLIIQADCLHYKTDLFTNVGVLISLVLATKWRWFDQVVGVGIVLYIIYSTWHIIKQSLDVLMDKELPEAIRQKILILAQSHPDVLGIHDLRTRSAGHNQFIQMHLDLSGDLSLQKAHDIAEEVEKIIQSSFPQTEILIHQDPIALTEV